jgi:hypothetical protein
MSELELRNRVDRDLEEAQTAMKATLERWQSICAACGFADLKHGKT